MKATKLFFSTLTLMLACFLIRPVAAQSMTTILLPIGEPIQQFVDSTQLSRQYRFNAVNDKSVFLLALSQDYDNAPSVVLSDAVSAENIAAVKMAVSGMCLRIAPGTASYTLNVAANQPQQPQWYGILLTQGEPTDMMCPNDLTDSFGSFFSSSGSSLTNGGLLSLGSGFDTFQSNCQASSGVNGNVNVRGLADQGSSIIGQIPVDAMVPVLGSTGNFLLVNLDGTPGFASGPALTISGDCSQTPIVTVDGTNVVPTDSMIDLGGIIRPDTNVGGLDTDALDLNGLTNGLGGLNLDAVADANQPGGGLNLNNGSGGLNLDLDGNAGDQPGIGASANDSNNGLNLDVDANASDQPGVTVTGLDDNNNTNVNVGTSGVDANVGNSGSGGTGTCLNVLGVQVNC